MIRTYLRPFTRITVLIALQFSILTGYSQTDFSPIDQELESKKKELGEDFVMMIWKDTLVYKKESKQFNSKTIAPLGSSSKWLTAALVMVFVDEGKISLDDKVARWLPEFERYGKNYITVRHCLSHMTGISDEGNAAKKTFQRKKFSSLEEEVNSFAARKIRVNAGDDFFYGDIGINIAARVLEVISKKKFDQLIKQKLLNPLTMRRTTFSTIDASALNPATGAQSSADEYIKFLAMLLNKGKSNGKQILSEESVRELIAIQTKDMDKKNSPKYAAGWNHALGSWVIGEDGGEPKALAAPSETGTWPMIDFCRGYASIVLLKEPLDEDKKDIHLQIKNSVDMLFNPGNCP